MHIEKIVAIQKKNNFPFYIYDENKIIDNIKIFKNISYDNKLIAFATMANNNENFLKIIKKQNISVFVNSLKHLNKCIKIGFDSKNIVFTSSAMSEDLMKDAHKRKCILNLDSIDQLKQWFNLFPNSKVGIRCNIGKLVKAKETRAGYFIGEESRIGLTIDEIKQLKNKDKINGLHLYPGTDILDYKYFESCYSALSTLVNLFPNLEYIDFGGGFGIEDKLENIMDWKKYNLMICKLMNKINKLTKKEIKLILEPGRVIGGNTAYFVTKVMDIKKRDKTTFVGLNVSTAQFPRPLIYPDNSKHPIIIYPKHEGRKINTTIYGCSTYSKDYFAKNVLLPKLKIGDLIIFGNAGSYCSSMFCEFLGFEKPKELFIR
jgi:diaminopimelate decarboxylase